MSLENKILLSSNSQKEKILNILTMNSNSKRNANNKMDINDKFRQINTVSDKNKDRNQLTTNYLSNKNIFLNKKNINSCYSPVKMNLNQSKKDIKENNLNTIEYSITNKDNKFERIISGKSIKSLKSNCDISQSKTSNVYRNDSFNYEPFSSKRILTIPNQGNHFGYSIDDKGEIELLDDPDKNVKFNGTKNNSIGPGQYNVVMSPRKRFVMDWSRVSEEKNMKTEIKNKIKDVKEVKLLSKLDNLYLSSNLNDEKNDMNDNCSISSKNKSINYIDNIKLKNKIFRNNDVRMKDYKTDDDYINLTLLNYQKQKEESKIMPGPGAYHFTDEFNIIPKKNKFQNFGSSVSRDLLYSPNRKLSNSIDNYLKYSFFTDNLQNDNKYAADKKIKNEKLKLIQNSNFFKQKLKVEMLKEQSIKNKKELNDRLGPGTYEPEIQKLTTSVGIENFGSLDKRKLTQGKADTPGAGAYIGLDDWSKKNVNYFRTIETESSGKKYKLDMLNYNQKINTEKNDDKMNELNYKSDAYYKQSIDHDNRVICSLNKNLPAFGSWEPRFHIFKSQINSLNGIGRYDLIYPLKQTKQRLSPFLYSSSREDMIKNRNENVGPGSYNKFDTFFDWNKKTYNIKVKNKLDKFKIINKS